MTGRHVARVPAGRTARVLLWLLLFAVGLGLAIAVIALFDLLGGDAEDGTDVLTGAFFGIIALGLAGLVATWLFATPRPHARRWLTWGVPALALVAVGAMFASLGPVVLLLFPGTWLTALTGAWSPWDGGTVAER